MVDACEIRSITGCAVKVEGMGAASVRESTIGGEGMGDERAKDCLWLLDKSTTEMTECAIGACLHREACPPHLGIGSMPSSPRYWKHAIRDIQVPWLQQMRARAVHVRYVRACIRDRAWSLSCPPGLQMRARAKPQTT